MSGLIKISGEWKPGPFIYRDEAVFGLNHVGQPICEGRSNLDISVDFDCDDDDDSDYNDDDDIDNDDGDDGDLFVKPGHKC